MRIRSDICVSYWRGIHLQFQIFGVFCPKKTICTSSILCSFYVQIWPEVCTYWLCNFRFLAVVYPLRYPMLMTPSRSYYIIVFLWLHACVVGFGPFYCGRWSDEHQECLLSSLFPPAFILVMLTGQYTVSSTIMIVLYSKVLYVAHQQSVKIHATAVNFNQSGSNVDISKDTKAAKTLALVLGVFLASWTPFFCLAAALAVGYTSEWVYTGYMISVLMGTVNSCLNPIIYGWKSSEFRKAYATLVKRMCRSCDWAQTCSAWNKAWPQNGIPWVYATANLRYSSCVLHSLFCVLPELPKELSCSSDRKKEDDVQLRIHVSL